MEKKIYKTFLKKLESNRAWQKEYPEKSKKATENWYKKNPGRHDKTSKAWRLRNLEKIKVMHTERIKSGQTRHDSRKSKYGITKEQFEKMIKIQKNKCAICKKVFTSPKAPAVDHNHLTKKVRGLLCSSCNMGLGGFKDNLKYLLQAIKYLRKK